MKVAVVGLGKLGCPMVAVFAEAGHEVFGVDKNEDFVKLVKEGKPTVREPDLDWMMEKYSEQITATTDTARAAAYADMIFLIVPTPSLPDGSFDDSYLREAIRDMVPGIKDPGKRRTIVIVSTVSPGTTRQLHNYIEELTGLEVGNQIGLAYSPELIALGNVVRDLKSPDVLLIGTLDRKTANDVEDFYMPIHHESVAVSMSYESAELAKISINTYVTSKIAFANMIGRICHFTPGADACEVLAAVGMDRRIGGRYLKPGTGFGGPCFPRDNRALARHADVAGMGSEIPQTIDAVNEQSIDDAMYLVQRFSAEFKKKVAVLGLAYKPGTYVTEESHGVKIAQKLIQFGYEVRGYDPEIHAAKLYDIKLSDTLEQALNFAEIVLVMTPCLEFMDIGLKMPARKMAVVDMWNIVDDDSLDPYKKYVVFGKGEL